MDFYKLHYFMTVAKYEHITQASQELHISQPALSKIISQLEAELGVSLFTRSGKSIRLNEHGRLFLDFCNRMMQEYGDVCGRLAEYADGQSGSVTIGCSFAPRTPDWLSDFVYDYIKTRPKISFACAQMSIEDLQAALDRHELDIIFTETPLVGANILWRKLFTERIAVLLSPDHPLAAKEELHVRDLEGEVFFSTTTYSGVQDITKKYCRKAGFVPFVRYSGHNIQIIGDLVAAGEGVAFISEHVLGSYMAFQTEGSLVSRMLSDDFARRTFGMAVLKNRLLTTAASDFYDLIANYDFATGFDRFSHM